MQEIKIEANDAGQRLDKFLQKHYRSLSKSMMYKAIRNKKIKVNRKRCTFDQRLEQGDVILLFLPPQFLEVKQKEIPAYTGAIDILYEDDDVLIVNKPVGLLSQSDEKGQQDTLVQRIQYDLYQKGEYDPMQENSFAPAICHRLDKNTSGLVIAAKNAKALRLVNEAIAQRKVHKYYCAKIQGQWSVEKKEICCYIRKEETKAKVSWKPLEGYKEAKMEVILLKQGKDSSIVLIDLHTGRFHQIRASLAKLGYPLVGDHKYGYKGLERNYALCAYRIRFETLDLAVSDKDFTIPIPF